MESGSCFPLHCAYYDDLKASIFHEMSRQNPELFCCTDDPKINTSGCSAPACLSLRTLPQKPGKEGEMKYSVCIYSHFSNIIRVLSKIYEFSCGRSGNLMVNSILCGQCCLKMCMQHSGSGLYSFGA